jgi:hypothetical protein
MRKLITSIVLLVVVLLAIAPVRPAAAVGLKENEHAVHAGGIDW